MMQKKRLVVLMGKSGSGKDTIIKKIVSRCPHLFHKVVATTSRPRREGEVDGLDYHFVTREEFETQWMKDEFVTASRFKGWHYGTQFSEFQDNKINIGIFAPLDIKILQQYPDEIELTIFYIEVSDKNRLLRSLNREDAPDVDEIIRRYQADAADFSDLEIEDLHLVFNNQDIEEAILAIDSVLGQKYKELFVC